MSGSRRDSDTATGDVRDNTRQLIVDATNAAGRDEHDDAIGLYTDVLELAPSNTEALAYRGWARFGRAATTQPRWPMSTPPSRSTRPTRTHGCSR